jgi:hypothetical protein
MLKIIKILKRQKYKINIKKDKINLKKDKINLKKNIFYKYNIQ